jgi:RNA polymerase sigma-70 factor (ECF subfamily)
MGNNTRTAPKPANWPAKYYRYLFNFSMARVKNKQKAEDMVQDTFLKALKKQDQFQGISSEQTWLTAILKNNIYDAQRREAQMIPASQVGDSEATDEDFFDNNGNWKKENVPTLWQSDQIDQLEQKELAGTMDKCISVLPENWAFIFKMKYMDDEKSDVICERMDITAQNFWTIIHRAKLKLKSCIERLWFKS